jgi:hypothetical protein
VLGVFVGGVHFLDGPGGPPPLAGLGPFEPTGGVGGPAGTSRTTPRRPGASRRRTGTAAMLLDEEKDRFTSRLAMIPGVRPMPSVGQWILLHVDHPTELARRVNRRLAPGVMSVPRQVDGAVRIAVADPRTNEQMLRAMRELV